MIICIPGYRALCLPVDLREPVLTAFSVAQTMIIASRGLRSYNIAELQLVFDRGFLDLFTAMERIYEINHDRKYASKLKRHRKNPRKNPAPKRFVSKKRCVSTCSYVFRHVILHAPTCDLTHYDM